MRFSQLFPVLLAACTGPGTAPEELAREVPPARYLDVATRSRVAEQSEFALRAADAGKWDEASSSAEAALSLDPRAAMARVARARCLMHEAQLETPPELVRWQRAEGELLIAGRLAPEDPEVQLARARFLASDKHISAAVACLEQSLEKNPKHVATLRFAAQLRYEIGEERTAQSLLVRLLAEAPDDVESLYQLAQCRTRIAVSTVNKTERQKALRDAAQSFERYVQAAPQDGDGWLGEAFARFEAARAEGKTGLEREATLILGLYKMAANLKDLSPEPLFGRAVVLEELGRTGAARETYGKALQLAPNHIPSLLNLAASLEQGGESGQARAICERALALELLPEERRRLQRFLATATSRPAR